ncbi:MAG: hypothetical protein ACP5RS_02930 [Thermoplasmata archaeon]
MNRYHVNISDLGHNKEIYIYETIRGKKSDAGQMYSLLNEQKINSLGVLYSDELLWNIYTSFYNGFPPVNISSYDETYLHASGYDTIEFPDPLTTELIIYSYLKNIPVIPLDMVENDYTGLYCELISTYNLMSYEKQIKKFVKSKDKSDIENIKMLNETVQKIDGYKKLDIERAKYMANKIITGKIDLYPMLVISDIEITPMLLKELDRRGCKIYKM